MLISAILLLENLVDIYKEQTSDLFFLRKLLFFLRKLLFLLGNYNFPKPLLVIIETDHNAFTDQTKKQRRQKIAEEIVQTASNEDQATARTTAEAFLLETIPENIFGSPKAGKSQWASIIRLLDPIDKSTINLIRLEQNEAAMCLTCCQFMNQPIDAWFLVVGITANFRLNPREISGGAVDVYRFVVMRDNC